MANLVNLSIDTRTFPEICKSLTKSEWVKMQGDLILKVKRSGQCIYNWKVGKRTPSSPSERKAVSDYINKYFKLNTRYWYLFPES